MANELKATWANDRTVYGCIRNVTAQVWHKTLKTFQAYGTYGADMGSYDVAMTESGDSGLYYGAFDSNAPAGAYTLIFYEQEGSSPADTDTPVGFDYGQWTGTAWLSLLDLVSGPGDTEVVLSIQTTDGDSIQGIQVWLNDQNDQTTTVVQPRTTDSTGQVTFYLSAGHAYHVFCENASYSFADATIEPTPSLKTFALGIATTESVVAGKKTCAQLIERILYLVGRKETSSALPLSEIILDALNEAQRNIVERVPNCADLRVEDTTTFDASTSACTLDLTQLTRKVAHVHRIWALDGLASTEVIFGSPDWFSRRYPDVSAESEGMPLRFTRKGDTITFSCPFSSDYDGLDIRIDYTARAAPFTGVSSARTSDFEDADEGLILWGQVKALRAIAKGNVQLLEIAQAKEAEWTGWLDEFETRHDLDSEETLDDKPSHFLYEEP